MKTSGGYIFFAELADGIARGYHYSIQQKLLIAALAGAARGESRPRLSGGAIIRSVRFENPESRVALERTAGAAVPHAGSHGPAPASLLRLHVFHWFSRLPQFNRISLWILQPGKPAIGIGLRIDLDCDSRSL